MIERKSWSEKIGVLHIAFTRPSRVMQTANMISAVLFANEDTHILPPLTRLRSVICFGDLFASPGADC